MNLGRLSAIARRGAATAVAPEPVSEVGLASVWHFDEADAADAAVDSWGANTLAQTNSPPVGAGTLGGCRSGTGSGDNMLFSIADSASLRIVGDATITFWYKSVDLGVAGVVTKWASGSGFEYAVYQSIVATKLSFTLGADATNIVVSSAANLSANTWYFVAVQHDATNKKIGISLNGGTRVWSAAYSAIDAGSANDFRVLRDQSSNYLNGSIDELCFWSRLLSAGELVTLYGSGAGLAFPWGLTTLVTGDPVVAETQVGDVLTQEIQTITLAHGPTAGTWRADASGAYDLAFNASDADVDTDLDSLLGLGVSVVRSGSGTAGAPYVYTVTWTLPGAQPLLVPQSAPGSKLRVT